ncbi:ATP-binding protein [Streptomyces sp. NPDC048637]|uniref:ATP-binding protein n=1 Tax=Streptomyces sp. NPDC048637 TaxID=3155636 RepID=UPI003412F99B
MGPLCLIVMPAPLSVRRVRAAVRGHLAARGLTTHSTTAELLASELVTNALRHAPGSIRLSLSIQRGAIHCEVQDTNPTAPTVRRAQYGDEGGRGMLLVQQLAREWGSRASGRGKAVWFDLEL